MKLLFCPRCHDVRKLPMKSDMAVATGGAPRPPHQCKCGASWGYYTDDINAVYGGDAVMLGISNHSLEVALHLNKQHPPVGPRAFGHPVEAFIIPESAPSVRREQPPQGEPKP